VAREVTALDRSGAVRPAVGGVTPAGYAQVQTAADSHPGRREAGEQQGLNPGPTRRARLCDDCGAADRIVLVRTEAGAFCRACLSLCVCISPRSKPHRHGPTGCLTVGCGCPQKTDGF